MLSTELEHNSCFDTPKKQIQRTPATVETGPHTRRTEPKFEQMADLMTMLGMDDANLNSEERDLVQNDALWMQEIMTVQKRTKIIIKTS